MNNQTANYIAVPYKGRSYMCVEGSARATHLRDADYAWRVGAYETSALLLNKALTADGCAFEHREVQNG